VCPKEYSRVAAFRNAHDQNRISMATLACFRSELRLRSTGLDDCRGPSMFLRGGHEPWMARDRILMKTRTLYPGQKERFKTRYPEATGLWRSTAQNQTRSRDDQSRHRLRQGNKSVWLDIKQILKDSSALIHRFVKTRAVTHTTRKQNVISEVDMKN